jgi:two-component system cell cycle sensor histidine kinase/response regulator CckA
MALTKFARPAANRLHTGNAMGDELFDALPDAVLGIDRHGRVAIANARAAELLGAGPGELVGSAAGERVVGLPEEAHGRVRAYAVRADGVRLPVEIALSSADGLALASLRPVEEVPAGLRSELDDLVRRRAVVADLGRVALTLRREEELFDRALRALSEALDMDMVGVSELTDDGDHLILRRSRGWGLDDGGEPVMAIAGTQSGWTLAHGATVVEDTGCETRFPTAALRGFGVVSGIAVPLTVEGEPVGVLSAFCRERRAYAEHDVEFVTTIANVLAVALARSRTETALEQSSARLQAVLDNAPTAIFLKDHPGGRYLIGNASLGDVSGMEAEAMYGRTDEDLFGAELAEVLREHDREVAASRRPQQFVERVGGRVFQSVKFPLIDDAGVVGGVGGIALDITEQLETEAERQRLEDRLRQSERLESVGQLAGGIAHDFNNLLAVIANFAGFVAAEVPPGSTLADDVQQIIAATDRAGELTRRLLQFSRRQPSTPEVLDAGAIVHDVEQLLERTLGDHIVVRTAHEDGLWRVRADRGQLEQVLMNLAINARDAMPGGGVLRIETRNEREDSGPADADGEPIAGRFVRLTVADTGAGMTPEVAARALEPFFTTKPTGLGTGLGLSSVYGIVTQAGGALELSSAVGHGTTVTVWLPATSEAPARTVAEAAPSQTGTGQPVLVVEDQPGVREVARRILSDAGYAVVTAEDSDDALRAVEEDGVVPAVLVTDVLMPGLSGPDLAQALRRRLPALPVVFVSGFPEVAQAPGPGSPAPTLFVEKPFRAAQLLQAVAEAIGSPG